MDYYIKNHYIRVIKNRIIGATGRNFQSYANSILRQCYNYLDIEYEMPGDSGGDDKNDGWLPKHAVFFQIYSPEQMSKRGLRKDIRDKFEADLDGLLKVLNQGKWNKKINKFIYLVNTSDQRLPKNPDDFYNKTASKLASTYEINNFEVIVTNVDFIIDLLFEVNDESVFERCLFDIEASLHFEFNDVTINDLLETLKGINKNIIKDWRSGMQVDFNRISTPEKIVINDLLSIQPRIERALTHLDIVEETVSTLYAQDYYSSSLFISVKDYIISIYNELSSKFSGSELFFQLYEELLNNDLERYEEDYGDATFLLIVYVFDSCDIFEKEEVGVEDATSK